MVGQRQQAREASRVALDAGVGRLAGEVAADERRDDVGREARLVVDEVVRRPMACALSRARATAGAEQQLRSSSPGQSFTVAARTS